MRCMCGVGRTCFKGDRSEISIASWLRSRGSPLPRLRRRPSPAARRRLRDPRSFAMNAPLLIRPGAILFSCTFNSVRSPIAGGTDAALFRPRDLCRLGRREARRGSRPVRRRRDGRNRRRSDETPAAYVRGARRFVLRPHRGRSHPKPTTRHWSSPGRSPATCSTGRPWIRPRSKGRAIVASMPIAKSATFFRSESRNCSTTSRCPSLEPHRRRGRRAPSSFQARYRNARRPI